MTPEPLPLRSAVATTLVGVAEIGVTEVTVGAGEGMSTRCQTPDVQVDAQRQIRCHT